MDLNLFFVVTLKLIILTRIKTTAKQCQEYVFDPRNYVGCIQDTNYDRSLPGAFTAHSEMDNNRCMLYCKDKGFNFSGTQYSYECYCGNDPYRLLNTVIDPSYIQNFDCSFTCVGNASQICGGIWRLTVYRTGLNNTNPKYRRIGNQQLVAQPIDEIVLQTTQNGVIFCALQCKRNGVCGVFSVSGSTCKLYQYQDVCDGYTGSTVASVYMLQ